MSGSRTEPGPAAGSRGFTMVEVLVAIALLAFLALGVQSMLIGSLRQNKLALSRTVATNLAAARIAQVTTMPLQSSANFANYAIPGETAAAGPPITLTAGYGSVPGYPQFSRTVRFDYSTPVAGLLRVQVDVSWVDRGSGSTKNHRVVTLLHPDITTGG